MTDLVPACDPPRIPVRGGGTFPVRRIYCVGRNFADHAREMGAQAPASREARGRPVFFSKPADALVLDGQVPYPPATSELHHEVELTVAIGRDAAPGVLDPDRALDLVFGYGIGLDLTRRDLQAQAKAAGLPWDIAKGFDHSAPVSELLPAAGLDLRQSTLSLEVNGNLRQSARLDQMIWSVADILHELSQLYRLRAGDLVLMGTPAGVAALAPGDRCHARLDDLLSLDCVILPALT